MARVRKPQPTMETLLFATPEQKVLRFLLSEPTTSFTPRVISSKLKGVRGLGGAEGITRILTELETLGMVTFVDNRRAVRIQDDSSCVQMMKTFTSLCELEGLKKLLEPVATRIILFGSRATGKSRSDSNYDLCVVSQLPDEVKKIAGRHPLGRNIELLAWTPDDYHRAERADPTIMQKLTRGIVLWGTAW
jgi:predicted nucleotidyltransferase